MNRALVTFGVGPMEAMRRHTLPSHLAYAERHGYTPLVQEVPELFPPAWGKIPILRRILQEYDAVLWIDADVLILDRSEDIGDAVGSAAMGLVAHVTGEGRIPNCGVWYLTREALPLLDAVRTFYPRYRNHVWWEQAAVIDLLEQGWADRTAWLDPGWNRHRHDTQTTERVRFLHFTAVPDRFERCRMVAEFLELMH